MRHQYNTTYRQGFSLIELIVIIAVISLLASLLYPAFLTARGQARQVSCSSNLRQIGLGLTTYIQDFDGYYPYATTIADRIYPGGWKPRFPQYSEDIPYIPQFHEVLQPYLHSPQLFACPADIGTSVDEAAKVPLDAFPSSYEKYRTSYFYLSLLAACRFHEARPPTSSTSLMTVTDHAGHWHGTLLPLQKRYNVLFADGHVKNLTSAQFEAHKGTPINELPANASGCEIRPES